MFMWKVSATTRTDGSPTAGAERHRLVEPVDHVVLVPVEGFQEEGDPLGPGVLAQLAEGVEEHLPVAGRRARRLERRQPAGEHAPGGRRHRADAAQLGDHRELGAQVAHGVAGAGRVEVADEVVHLDADGGHDHPGGAGAAQLGQPAGERAVAAAAQLDALVAEGDGEGVLLDQVGARKQLLLAGQRNGHREPQHHLEDVTVTAVEQRQGVGHRARVDDVAHQRQRVDAALGHQVHEGVRDPVPVHRPAMPGARVGPETWAATSWMRLWWNSSPRPSPSACPW